MELRNRLRSQTVAVEALLPAFCSSCMRLSANATEEEGVVH